MAEESRKTWPKEPEPDWGTIEDTDPMWMRPPDYFNMRPTIVKGSVRIAEIKGTVVVIKTTIMSRMSQHDSISFIRVQRMPFGQCMLCCDRQSSCVLFHAHHWPLSMSCALMCPPYNNFLQRHRHRKQLGRSQDPTLVPLD